MIYVHDESIPKKKAFSRRASKSFGEAAGEGLRRWLSIRRGLGRDLPAIALDAP